ncbi:cellulose synthase/poly-beta-1,6-N-acetylglucosamine synthase-like glycosyltransferase [Lactobacillus colini]|uniref:Cellulose synthase/poly-beta-1,6-N-acetylglucosamine synthase-like glycosyltransferase n=1 Tax=Lactobacillus colini TaxID=1819254 RepID=A0ABS4MF43_9LACO|nr:hypothetical protein [Lactobacillus colini]MBP2058311.1 cellulose synthase/poly-beta-1,6-N-acetylglucosamine synthase-like glycosyltransferase [Lactobacillus colini]
MKKKKYKQIERKDSQSIIRAFILLNLLLLGFVLLYGLSFFEAKLPANGVIMVIMIVTIFYLCLDFYISGTLLPEVKTISDMKKKIIQIGEGLIGVNITGVVLFVLNNPVTILSVSQLIAVLIVADVALILLSTVLLYVWVKVINSIKAGNHRR